MRGSNSGDTSVTGTENADMQFKVATVYVMAEVQLLDKPRGSRLVSTWQNISAIVSSASVMTPRNFV